MSLKLVWQPIRINKLEVANRIARSANTTTITAVGIDEQFIAYHAARARGGVGLTVLEAGAVHPTSQLSYAIDDAVCAGFERLMTAVRPHGMRIIQQLWHGGHHLPGAGGRLPWACSDIPSPFTNTVGQPMGKAEIDEMIAAFAAAARRCRDAGIDGVEVHAGHGYLVQQFMSPLSNTRSDEYGGSLENRTRFAMEVMRAVRKAVGPDFPVGVRMSSSTGKGNITAAELGSVARRMQDEGLIDFLDASHGDYFEMSRMTSTLADPAGYEMQPNQDLLRAVTVPRLVTGRYRTLEEAEQTLREGDAELVSLVRAQIADPDLVRKTREGKVDQVRPCIACNQGCVGGLLTVAHMGCAVNPAAGRELTLDETLLGNAAVKRNVMVVGGGPAGMEAARVAALRGHQVILAEAGAHLGGNILAAKCAPKLHGIADITDWLEREVYRLGVDVRRGTYIEPNDVLAENPDVVIVATGAAVRDDGVQAAIPGETPTGVDLPHVTNAYDLLMDGDRRAAPKSAVVLDDVGHYEAVAAAEYLIERGAAVHYVTTQGSFAPQMKGSSRDDMALQRLYKGNFRLLVGHFLAAIHPAFCIARPLRTQHEVRIEADCVVLVTHRAPIRSLYDALRGKVADVRLVGDAASPRNLQTAIRDGHLAARDL
jgi:2,4-dienoyl-CoA reductase-like NADH-dependent reductase (Old Yellow Enzyme family)/thioredoxin reductase